ncbi:MAG: hypothetical protein HOV68_29740 [Streptomycetaceae bacterium]|nr:hypothetical protein [Streptomycetaceae bacterium]
MPAPPTLFERLGAAQDALGVARLSYAAAVWYEYAEDSAFDALFHAADDLRAAATSRLRAEALRAAEEHAHRIRAIADRGTLQQRRDDAQRLWVSKQIYGARQEAEREEQLQFDRANANPHLAELLTRPIPALAFADVDFGHVEALHEWAMATYASYARPGAETAFGPDSAHGRVYALLRSAGERAVALAGQSDVEYEARELRRTPYPEAQEILHGTAASHALRDKSASARFAAADGAAQPGHELMRRARVLETHADQFLRRTVASSREEVIRLAVDEHATATFVPRPGADVQTQLSRWRQESQRRAGRELAAWQRWDTRVAEAATDILGAFDAASEHLPQHSSDPVVEAFSAMLDHGAAVAVEKITGTPATAAPDNGRSSATRFLEDVLAYAEDHREAYAKIIDRHTFSGAGTPAGADAPARDLAIALQGSHAARSGFGPMSVHTDTSAGFSAQEHPTTRDIATQEGACLQPRSRTGALERVRAPGEITG